MTDFVSVPFYDLFHESSHVPKLRRSLSSLLAGGPEGRSLKLPSRRRGQAG